MGRSLTAIDTSMLVMGIIMFILAISLFGIVGAIISYNAVAGLLQFIQFGIGGMYLITAILAIASGASGHKCPYVTVIVISILGIFVSIGGGIVAALAVATNFLPAAFSFAQSVASSSSNSYNSYDPYDPYGAYGTINDIVDAGVAATSSLPWGVSAVNFISFIVMIVISCISCCGTCCNNNAQVPNASMQYNASPPGYVSYPPEQPPQGGNRPPNIRGYDGGVELKHI